MAKLPADRKADGPGIGSATSCEISRESGGETLVVRRSLTVSRREIPPSDYAALGDFFSALAREDAGALALADRD